MLFSSLRFIQPCQPTLRVIPPSGEQWLHEVKFDGWRIQPQKAGRHVALYTKNGHDFSRVFRHLAKMLAALPVRSAVIDGELTACDDRGVPDFRALHFRDIEDDQLCVWAFDLLHLDGNDLRPLPLVERKYLLGKLVYKTGIDWLRLSEPFNDGAKLLTAAERMGLEGVVSKKRDAPYRSGKSDWIKVKCQPWRDANKERWRLFDKRG
jgi:bifunctional non-homologous end joining protein LigD